MNIPIDAFSESVAKLTDCDLLDRIEGQEKAVQNLKKNIGKFQCILAWENSVLQTFKEELEKRNKVLAWVQ